MAPTRNDHASQGEEAREMPYVRNAVLLAGFVIVVIVAVVTVLLPELEDEPDAPQGSTPSAESPSPPSDDTPADAEPTDG